MSISTAKAEQRTTEDSVRPQPIRSHRSPRLIGLGIALIALGGLGAAWLATTMSNTVAVVALQSTVSRGDVIEPDDLTTASITLDPNLSPMAASNIDTIVGQRAANDLPVGSILTPESITDEPIPAPGFSVVPVAVPNTRLPAEGLKAGSVVRVVNTPREGDEPPGGEPFSQTGTVVGLAYDEETGQTVVNLTVPEATAPQLAARAATGRVAFVLDSGTDS